MVFEYKKEILSIIEAAESLPEVKEIRSLPNHKDIFEYIYFMYDRKSIYATMLYSDRIKVVRTDRFVHLKDDDYNKLEILSEKLIKKIELLQYTPKEKLLLGIDRKIGEYLEYWNNTSITSKNHKAVADTINRAEGLLKLQERLQKIVGKEKSSKQMGGTVKTMVDELT